MKIKIVKNKIAVPYKEALINLVYGEGIDRADELFQIALKAGFIHRGGAWYSYVDENGEIQERSGQQIRTQGKDGLIELIRTIPELYAELESKIRGVVVEADDMDEEEIQALRSAKD